jgi:stage VI sporulation protein D
VDRRAAVLGFRRAVDRPEDAEVQIAEEAFFASEAEASRTEQQLEASIAEEAAEQEQEQEARKQQEVQIAFSAGGEEAQSDVGFRALLQSSRREQALREAAEQVSQEEQQALNNSRTTAIEEEIEWKKLFLSKAEDNEFRKIRMCIVQKEETLEQIAVRYSLNPRDILNHNRLHESAVEEGQLLYIP